MILNYLETRGDLDMNRVGIFGEGSGGAIAILAATADHRIKTLDLLRPWGDWQDWLATSALIPQEQRPAFLKPDFLKRLEPLEPVRFLPELKDQSIRIQMVDSETDTKKSFAKLESVAPSSAKIVHYRDSLEFRKAASDGHVFDWLAVELNGAKQETTSPQSATKSAALPTN